MQTMLEQVTTSVPRADMQVSAGQGCDLNAKLLWSQARYACGTQERVVVGSQTALGFCDRLSTSDKAFAWLRELASTADDEAEARKAALQ